MYVTFAPKQLSSTSQRAQITEYNIANAIANAFAIAPEVTSVCKGTGCSGYREGLEDGICLLDMIANDRSRELR